MIGVCHKLLIRHVKLDIGLRTFDLKIKVNVIFHEHPICIYEEQPQLVITSEVKLCIIEFNQFFMIRTTAYRALDEQRLVYKMTTLQCG